MCRIASNRNKRTKKSLQFRPCTRALHCKSRRSLHPALVDSGMKFAKKCLIKIKTPKVQKSPSKKANLAKSCSSVSPPNSQMVGGVNELRAFLALMALDG